MGTVQGFNYQIDSYYQHLPFRVAAEGLFGSLKEAGILLCCPLLERDLEAFLLGSDLIAFVRYQVMPKLID